MNFFCLITTGLPTKFPRDFQDEQQLNITVTSNMQQMENWLVILYLLRKKFHAKHIFVLSSFMKLGQGTKKRSEL